MALNIPNVGNGMDIFAKGFYHTSDNLLKKMLQREMLKQKAEEFEKELAFKKQQEARLGANSGINHQILEQQLLGLQHKNDPMYDINQFKALQDMIAGGGATSSANDASADFESTGANVNGGDSPNTYVPPNNGDDMALGQPISSGQKAIEAQQQASAPAGVGEIKQPENITPAKVTNGIDVDLMRKHPELRAWYKKKFGIDPLAGESNVLHGPARDASDLAKLKKDAGEDSEVYRNAKAQYDASIDAKKDLRDLRARTKAGLKSGEKEFFDPKTGSPLGKEIPLTEKERDSEKGNILFNELYPYVYKGASPFSGEGSISRLENAAANYKTDPKAKKLMDDFLLSEKMLAATTVNEASTLKAGKTNTTYNMLKESLNAQDIPKIANKLIKQYGIPASASLQASMRYQQLLSEARQKAAKGAPATQKLYYNPDMQAQHEAQVSSEGTSKPNKKGVVVINPEGKRFNTTEANAAHLPKGWKRG